MSSKLRYPLFKGKKDEDSDIFLQEFSLTVDTNRESDDADKLRISPPPLLKKRASKWFVGLLEGTQQNWSALRAAFEQEFCDLGYSSKVFHELNNLRQREGESLRQYTQRFKDLVHRTNQTNVQAMTEWYVG
ncbi:hypothetical protein R1flu_019506 [Riccia fluitans]|uniref:Retrotransposon gag domain-containing protein n=1 Tax=Riccia fluitans TaxID=41844 RepID=A0ABD1ZJ14_9MARC